ncbi:hypothetical protein BXZ70DRAFT_1005479 [Cristinia sonorae]|uniref:Uncharacterized protein n=1 Tax=Cristinia sonorae TaxID=1940300 RepID=A0A8K0UUS4_9AGAR|nr:hypothetical protein BXZ70DRAFT_1005479 [Cristinia sonorae]
MSNVKGEFFQVIKAKTGVVCATVSQKGSGIEGYGERLPIRSEFRSLAFRSLPNDSPADHRLKLSRLCSQQRPISTTSSSVAQSGSVPTAATPHTNHLLPLGLPPAMKSCLKHSPPATPDLSQLNTPEGSRPGTPPPTPLAARKCVSWCGNEGLEEIFTADDWDRSPAPMAPKLSYQDILELKQLQLNLPRAPQLRPICRPTHGPPISRFAAAPSLTPSKWKNRDDSRSNIDSDILPYLDSVPIQLLPLLDTPPTTPQSSSPSPTPTPLEPPKATDLETPPPASNHPIEAPSVTPSVSSHPSSSASAPAIIIDSPSSPTSGTLSSPTTPTFTSPVSQFTHDSTPKPPPRRTSNFQFLPLLPVQEQPKLPPEPPIQKPAEPKRKLNMTFLPLLPPTETPVSQPEPPSSIIQQQDPVNAPPSVAEAAAPTSTHHDAQSESEAEDTTDNESLSSGSHHHSSHRHRRTMNIPLYASSPTSSATPSLSSSASDTDDLDTESEAPSVVSGSSTPSSPMERDTAHEYYSRERNIAGEVSSYFPVVPHPDVTRQHHQRTPQPDVVYDMCSIAGPGQTPPLSSLYPELRKVDSLETLTGEMESEVARKIRLEAIPSPSLVPPSPFSLYPPSPETERFASSSGGGGGGGSKGGGSAVPKRTFFTRSVSKLATAASSVSEVDVEGEGEFLLSCTGEKETGMPLLRPSFSRRKDGEEDMTVVGAGSTGGGSEGWMRS